MLSVGDVAESDEGRSVDVRRAKRVVIVALIGHHVPPRTPAIWANFAFASTTAVCTRENTG